MKIDLNKYVISISLRDPIHHFSKNSESQNGQKYVTNPEQATLKSRIFISEKFNDKLT